MHLLVSCAQHISSSTSLWSLEIKYMYEKRQGKPINTDTRNHKCEAMPVNNSLKI